MADFEPGRLVVLKSLHSDLLNGLPEEDQVAIRAVVGHPVTLAGYSFGQAELEFVDAAGDDHTIWVDASLLQPA